MTNAKGHWLWVESHTEAQDQASTMNRYVDKLAEQIRLQNTNNLHEEILPSNRATLFYNNEIINTKVYDHLQNNMSNLSLRKYLQTKYDWTDSTFQDVNWNALKCALQSLPLTHRISLIKLTHNWSATGERNKIIEHKTDQCPFCHEENETLNHIFECSKHDKSKIWTSLQTDLNNIGTMPAIQGLMKKYFEGVTPPSIPELTSTDRIINQAIQAQEKIGIRQARLGHLSSHWNLVQDEYIGSLSPRGPENGSQWAPLAMKNILKATRAVWRARNDKLHANSIIKQANALTILHDIHETRGKLQQLKKGPDNILTTTEIHPLSQQNLSNLILWKKTYEKAVQVSLKSRTMKNTIQTSICQFFTG